MENSMIGALFLLLFNSSYFTTLFVKLDNPGDFLKFNKMINYSDTITPAHPKGYEDSTPLLVMQSEVGHFASGYLTHLYEDGSYFEYTDKLSFINDKYEVEEKSVEPGWYPILTITTAGIELLRSYIVQHFTMETPKAGKMTDMGFTNYVAVINDVKYYWRNTSMYMNENEVAMQIEYIINTNIAQ